MELEKFRVLVSPEAESRLLKLDPSVQGRIRKKLRQLERELPSRHLKHGVPYFVAEVGQYRIAFKIIETTRTKEVYYIGPHKGYLKWIHSQ